MVFKKAPRRETLEIQLTAMIDIFSIIIIFLILGTVFGVADLPVPPSMRLPKSVSKETVEAGPRITIHENKVLISILEKEFKLSWFKSRPGFESDEIANLKNSIKEYLDTIPKKNKGSDQFLNIIADHNLNYEDLFDVVKVMREAGFESVLFIAKAEGEVSE